MQNRLHIPTPAPTAQTPNYTPLRIRPIQDTDKRTVCVICGEGPITAYDTELEGCVCIKCRRMVVIAELNLRLYIPQ